MQKKLLRIKWVLITILFFIILSPICKALEIPVLHTNYRNYTYNCNSKQMPLYNFYDYEREKAVYQIRGNEGYIDDVGFRQIIGDINYPLDLINALYLATNEEKITDDNIDKRIAMQLYIYDRYAKSNSDKITYDFNTSSYTKIQEQLLKEGQEMIKEKDYNYELKTGEWQFIPYPLEEREQLDLFPIEIKEAENGFYVKSELEGHYDVEIPLKDKAYLALNFMSTHPKKASYVEILKPCLEISNFHFEVSPSIYEIHVPENQVGYQLEVEENAKKDQLVNYNLTIEDKYELKEYN